MFGAMNKRQMEKMMKQMGIRSEEVPADEVVIHCKGKDIVINSPQVTRVMMGGQETFQIAGKISERRKELFSEDDIRMVTEQTGASAEEAKKALEETKDIAQAILRLKG